MSTKIGLLLGREWSFPPAFIDEVARRDAGVTAEYAFSDRTLGGDPYLATHRLLAAGAVGLGAVELAASWSGRWENYASAYDDWSGFAQRAEGRASMALGATARIGLAWTWGRDDTDLSAMGWTEQGPRADLRLVLGPRTRFTVEAGAVQRDYHGDYGLPISDRLQERTIDGVAAFEWDVWRKITARFALLARWSDSSYDPFDYTKVLPGAAFGIMMTP